jgi:hypothetical protein
VSTLTFSPWLMNSGTWISWPVSRVAGLVRPVALSPARPGSVNVTTSSTEAGSSTNRTPALVGGDHDLLLLEQEVGGVAEDLGCDLELLVALARP